VASREEVDRLYGEMTAAGHRGLQAPYDAFLGRALCRGRGSGRNRGRPHESQIGEHRSAAPEV
jgi:hypothetical protein